MNIPVSLLPLLLLGIVYASTGVLYAAYIKLSARMLNGAQVSWKHCFLFVLIVLLLTLAERVAAADSGISMPSAVALALGAVLNLGFGGWFFQGRATDARGYPLGVLGGLQLTAIALLLLILSGFASQFLFYLGGLAKYAQV